MRKEEMKRSKLGFESTLFKAQTKLDVISRFFTIRNVTKLCNVEYRNIVIIKNYLKVISVINGNLCVKKVNREFHPSDIRTFNTLIKNNTLFKKSQISLSTRCYLYFYKFDIIFPIVTLS